MNTGADVQVLYETSHGYRRKYAFRVREYHVHDAKNDVQERIG